MMGIVLENIGVDFSILCSRKHHFLYYGNNIIYRNYNDNNFLWLYKISDEWWCQDGLHIFKCGTDMVDNDYKVIYGHSTHIALDGEILDFIYNKRPNSLDYVKDYLKLIYM